jgi:putative flavoprotein involved in K+ transport
MRHDVTIVGGGHAGLALSAALSQRSIDHIVLERDRIGATWANRWDSFCLVTPNWAIDLPGQGYDGPEPDGYMPKADLVAFLERYAEHTAAPVQTGVEVTAARADDEGFELDTSDGAISTRVLVAANGAYQRPHRPAGVEALPPELPVIDLTGYTNPAEVPDGGVLVVGSGQSGCQVSEELHDAGRDVVLACGKAPWVPRRLGDRDIVWWLAQTGFLDQPVASLPDPSFRFVSNPLTTGHGGGHDLHYRTLQAMGVTLAGHFVGCDGGTVVFDDALSDSVAWGDARHRDLMGLVRRLTAERGVPEPDIEDPPPFDASAAPSSLPVERFGSVILTGGFRPDYASWLPWPDAFDPMGFPLHTDGASTVVDGLHFMGVHFLRTRKSSILWGARDDAEVVAAGVAERLGAGPAD